MLVRTLQIAVPENLLDECPIPSLKPYMKLLAEVELTQISEIPLDPSFLLVIIFSPPKLHFGYDCPSTSALTCNSVQIITL